MDFRNAYVPGVMLTGAGQVVGLVEANGSGFAGAGGYDPDNIQLYESLNQGPEHPFDLCTATESANPFRE